MGIGCFNFGQIPTRSRIGSLPRRGQKFNGQLESQRKSNTSRTVRIPDFNGNWVLQLWTNSDSVALASSLPPNRVLLMRSRCNLVWWSVIFRGRLSSRLARTLQHAHRALFSTDIAHVVSCANSVLPIIWVPLMRSRWDVLSSNVKWIKQFRLQIMKRKLDLGKTCTHDQYKWAINNGQ